MMCRARALAVSAASIAASVFASADLMSVQGALVVLALRQHWRASKISFLRFSLLNILRWNPTYPTDLGSDFGWTTELQMGNHSVEAFPAGSHGTVRTSSIGGIVSAFPSVSANPARGGQGIRSRQERAVRASSIDPGPLTEINDR